MILLTFVVAVLAGATAAIAGFGIGSLLTPLLAARVGTGLAVAAVAIPHAVASALRAWRLRSAIDWSVLRGFGVLSAAGGLAGGLLYARLGNRVLTAVLGVLLIATAVAGVTGWTSRWRPGGWRAHLLGVLSGLFGGVVGNQGGLRAAALLTFGLAPVAFVATSTMTGLLVDAARTPIYLVRAGESLLGVRDLVLAATAGVVTGTLLGERLLFGLSADRFRRVIAALIGLVGVLLLVQAF
ncbi:MAG: TSUP family transporter [Bacillota bacterium]|jgi:uncharacterized membrane protein YfcA